MSKLIAPFSGNEPYIFVSYCHKDESRVYPVIAELMNKGYRVWYDAGINPGSDWPEVIAEHLNSCAVCIAFVSESSMGSHNCKKEINFAIMKNKPFLAVILDDTRLSPGMEMQLSTVQCILAYKAGVDVLSDIPKFDRLSACKGDVPADKYIAFEEQSNAEPEKTEDNVSDDKENCDIHSDSKSDDKGQNIPESSKVCTEEHLYLVRRSSGQNIVWKKKLVIGRARDCGYPLINKSNVSSHHAELTLEDGRMFIADRNSTNGTYINGTRMTADEKHELVPGDELRLADEVFVVRKASFEKKKAVNIERILTGNIYQMTDNKKYIIGSSAEMCDMVIPDKQISKQHLIVEKTAEKLYITDNRSTNGTRMLNTTLIPDKRVILSHGAAVMIANEPLYISYVPDETED